jgi:hypothetical protein
MKFQVTETQFARLQALFTQAPKAAWPNALKCDWISETERQIIRNVLAGTMTVENVIGKQPSKLPTDRALSKQEVKDLYTKSANRGPVVILGRPVTRVTR